MTGELDRGAIRQHLTGPISSLPVPFTAAGEIDLNGLNAIIDFNLSGGSQSSLLTWGDSLFSLLTDDEVATVTAAVARHTGNRGLTVAADGIWWTGKTIEFARYCREVGVDVLMVKPPVWSLPPTPDFVAHYQAVAAEIPVMLVTNVFAGAEALGLEVLEQTLATVPGVVAVKDDVGGNFARKLTMRCSDQWAVFAGGQKQNHLDLAHYGTCGYMSTFVSFFPQVSRTYWATIAAGVIAAHDWPLFDHIAAVRGGLDAERHGLLEIYRIAGRHRRAPYPSFTEAELEELRTFCRARGWAPP